jgi:hypothetical protein
MTPEEREEMDLVCRLIQEERDHQKFTRLMARLIEILRRKEHRLEDNDNDSTQVKHTAR